MASKVRGVSAALTVVAGLSGALAAQAAPEHCRALTGTVVTTQAPEGCPSPIGLCFTGELVTNSPLRGTTSFVAESAQPVDGTLVYTGTLYLTLPSGHVVPFASTGVLDLATGTFTETDVATGGVDARLVFSGTTDAGVTGFTGEAAGEVCGAPVPTGAPGGASR